MLHREITVAGQHLESLPAVARSPGFPLPIRLFGSSQKPTSSSYSGMAPPPF